MNDVFIRAAMKDTSKYDKRNQLSDFAYRVRWNFFFIFRRDRKYHNDFDILWFSYVNQKHSYLKRQHLYLINI